MRPWLKKNLCKKSDTQEKDYETMHDGDKEKLEKCQEVLFLKRILEDREDCVV